MNIGYFMSFTGFLAFNDPDFSARLFGQRFAVQGLLQLGPYLRFWAWIYIAITLFIAFCKPEKPVRPAGASPLRHLVIQPALCPTSHPACHSLRHRRHLCQSLFLLGYTSSNE